MSDPDAAATVKTVEELVHRVPRSHDHTQALIATQWLIRHDLGFDPAGILVRDESGSILEGWSVSYDIPGVELRIILDIPLAGSVHVS